MTQNKITLDFTMVLAFYVQVRFLSSAVLNSFSTNPLNIRFGGFFVEFTRVVGLLIFQNFEMDFKFLSYETAFYQTI